MADRRHAESPCPAFALICGGVFAGAGGYMVGRIFPILTPDAKFFIAIVGLISSPSGPMRCAQTDIKKLLACAAISQLGFMMLALGIGSWIGGLFHLITSRFSRPSSSSPPAASSGRPISSAIFAIRRSSGPCR